MLGDSLEAIGRGVGSSGANQSVTKPSIAVLPFANMSGEPEQEFFVDGLTEDIITELSRHHELFVISRNSSFVYKNKAGNLREVAEKLGAQYLVEGSVRKAGNRLRVTVQLIDTANDAHIWAEKFDRNSTTSSPFRTRLPPRLPPLCRGGLRRRNATACRASSPPIWWPTNAC